MIDGALVMLDFTKDFKLGDEGFITVKRRQEDGDGKGNYIPITNRGCIWQDNLGKIYLTSGHFFSQKWPENWTYWQGSQFYLGKEKIPLYDIWQYDINSDNWAKIPYKLKSGTQQLKRVASSGYTSIPSTNMSYAFGYVLQLPIRPMGSNTNPG